LAIFLALTFSFLPVNKLESNSQYPLSKIKNKEELEKQIAKDYQEWANDPDE